MIGAGRILIVEDSDTQALTLESLLQDAGHETDRTATAEAAMDHLRRRRPDLVIVDYHLPGMSGAEFCRLVRQRSGVEAMAILMLTDDAEADIERHGLESGADDHVRKSADSDVLLARVESLLRKPHARSPLGLPPTDCFRSHTIALVDDSPTYLAFLEGALEQEGYRIIAFERAQSALDLIEANCSAADEGSPVAGKRPDEIDCVVLDLVMPEMDGIELCRRLNEVRRAAHISLPILMVTSHDSKAEMMRALEAGADDFVRKSNDAVILKARIRALLRRKMLHDEHERILTEFRNKEFEVAQARAEHQAALARAALAEELERANAELKRTQTQLVHSAKMASLGVLVAGVAHEINNPLAYSLSHLKTVSAILGGLSSADIASEPARQKCEKAERRARDAIGGLERVAELIVKLRTFSRLDEGKFKRADIRDCIEATLPLVSHRLRDGIRLSTRYADDNEIYCAPGMLNQVILNLLSNAIDAVGEEGEVRVETSRSEEWLRLSVADTGAGIPESALERLFEPFFTTKDVGKGTGLGLAISYQIIESHQGRIEARNRDAGGAEFIVHLPTNLAEQDHASKPAA